MIGKKHSSNCLPQSHCYPYQKRLFRIEERAPLSRGPSKQLHRLLAVKILLETASIYMRTWYVTSPPRFVVVPYIEYSTAQHSKIKPSVSHYSQYHTLYLHSIERAKCEFFSSISLWTYTAKSELAPRTGSSSPTTTSWCIRNSSWKFKVFVRDAQSHWL